MVAHVDYEVGDTVAECNFDESGGGPAMETCCDKVGVVRGYNKPPLYFRSSSASSETGPSQDHTPHAGMRMNFNEVKMRTVKVCYTILKIILITPQTSQAKNAVSLFVSVVAASL